ncbi:MAG: hypothetical protein MJ200_05055 [Mycoplasmoidaceae bacterium]|nr:hypothetical protein [Mycoplasmoidaceae bacterium]
MVPLSPFELLRAKYYGDFVLGLSDYVNQDNKVRKVLDVNTRGKNEMIILDMLRDTYSVDDYLKLHKDDDFNDFLKLPKKIFLFISEVFSSYKDIKILITLAKNYDSHKTEFIKNRDAINEDIKQMLKTPHLEG